MIIPSGFAQVNFFFGASGMPTGAQLTLGLANASGKTAEEIVQDCADAWGTAGMTNCYSSATTMNKVLVKKGPNATGAQAEGGFSFVGTLNAAQSAPNTAFLVNKNTELGGRQGRGRWFIPGVPEGDVAVDGTILAARVTGINTILDTFVNTLTLDLLPPQLLHSDALAPTEILSMTCASRAATQRRRLRR